MMDYKFENEALIIGDKSYTLSDLGEARINVSYDSVYAPVLLLILGFFVVFYNNSYGIPILLIACVWIAIRFKPQHKLKVKVNGTWVSIAVSKYEADLKKLVKAIQEQKLI